MLIAGRTGFLIAACAALLMSLETAAAAEPNPYCVAGWGVLTKLNMPADSLDYDWNSPREVGAVEMGHWDFGLHRWHDYDTSTDQIIDAPRFRLWVTDHPGKIWLLGNEPDAQGITPAVYARMFHRYYEEIHPLDPSAKFAITALTGGATTDQFNVHSNWFAQALNEYKTQFGVIMPIDIWNIHQYSMASQIEDPDLPINQYVKPFIEWCHSVENGAYASAEMWITEMPIATWSSALRQEHVIWYAQQFLPRLERAGVSRFFWFVSQDWDGNYHDVGLVSLDGSVSALGQTYSALARTYPNPVPPIVPYVPTPAPAYAAFDFSGPIADPWMIKGGNWVIDNGSLRHSGIWPSWGTTCVLLHNYADVAISFKMKINAAATTQNWGAVLIRSASRFQSGETGYLIGVRQNGELFINDQTDGSVVALPGAVADTASYHDFRVLAFGSTISVWVDGILKAKWTDPHSRFANGYVAAMAGKADVSFDDFHVLKYPSAVASVTDEAAYTTELNRIRASWSISDPDNLLQGFRYAVGTSSGASDVVDWTYTTQNSIDMGLALAPGSTYYVSVTAVYPDSFESPVGATDGIIAAVGAASIDQLKRLTANTFCLISGKVVSGVWVGGFYVQEPKRASGIKVVGTLPVQAGDTVTLVGRLSLDGKEAALVSPVLVSVTHGDPPQPLGMTNRTIGGGGSGLQAAVVNNAAGGTYATGLCTTGLLAKTTGVVTYAEPNGLFAYIDDGSGIQDGSGHVGVKVSLGNGPIAQQGALAVITGWCSATDVSTRCARLLKPRSASDVYLSEIANYLANVSFETGAYPPWVYSGTGGALRSGTWYSVKALTGSYFFGSYGAKVCYSGTLYQTVDVPPGDYIASVWSVLFHPSTSNPEVAKNRVGIDPTGGADPDAPSVVWSAWDTTTLMTITPWHLISTPSSSVVGGRCTIFLQYLQNDAIKYHMNCFDDAKLCAVE